MRARELRIWGRRRRRAINSEAQLVCAAVVSTSEVPRHARAGAQNLGEEEEEGEGEMEMSADEASEHRSHDWRLAPVT